MKLLFDQNLSFKLCERLSALIPNSSHARLLGMERAEDRILWEYAKANGFTIVTMDADFADLAALFGAPPQIVWLRCGNQPTSTIEELLRDNADALAAFEQSDAACFEVY